MNIFDELEAQYSEIDNQYSSIELDARSKGYPEKELQYRRKRKLNDQAYFLFMFTRLEDKIRQQSSALISKKQASISSWEERAVWDMLSSDNIHFKKRLMLLFEKGRNDYELIISYYKERNSIAHGGNFTSPINMPLVIIEFKRLYSINNH